MKRPFFTNYLTKDKEIELINTSIKDFLLFYQIRIFLFKNGELKKTNNWAEKLGGKLRKILPTIDSKAFENEESWWNQIIAEYEDGYY